MTEGGYDIVVESKFYIKKEEKRLLIKKLGQDVYDNATKEFLIKEYYSNISELDSNISTKGNK